MNPSAVARAARHLRLLERRAAALWGEVDVHCDTCEDCRYVYRYQTKGATCGAVARQASLARTYLPIAINHVRRRLDAALGLEGGDVTDAPASKHASRRREGCA